MSQAILSYLDARWCACLPRGITWYWRFDPHFGLIFPGCMFCSLQRELLLVSFLIQGAGYVSTSSQQKHSASFIWCSSLAGGEPSHCPARVSSPGPCAVLASLEGFHKHCLWQSQASTAFLVKIQNQEKLMCVNLLPLLLWKFLFIQSHGFGFECKVLSAWLLLMKSEV